MSINLNDIAILDINGVDYRCIISGITKSKALNLLQNADLNERSGTLWNINFLTVYKNGQKHKVWWNWNWKTQMWPI